MNIRELSTVELMGSYADLLHELNRRNAVRTYNSPVGDYAEWLVAERYGFQLEANSQKGFDAFDNETHLRYQVKSRWERGTPSTQSRELNVIRNYESNQFDYLVVIIFDERFNVKEAYQVPHAVIKKYAKYSKHQNGYILIALGPVLYDTEVKNVINLFR